MTRSIEDYKKQATLTVPEVAEILRIGRSKAYEAVHQNLFPHIRIKNAIRIPTQPFFEWLNSSHEERVS
jgi:excisionase family DNA binding protein